MKAMVALFAGLLLAGVAPAKDPKPPKEPKPPKPSASMDSPEKAEFRRMHPCPATGKTTGSCPGYVIAYIQSPKQGGAHTPMNFQWLSKAEAQGKTRVK